MADREFSEDKMNRQNGQRNQSVKSSRRGVVPEFSVTPSSGPQYPSFNSPVTWQMAPEMEEKKSKSCSSKCAIIVFVVFLVVLLFAVCGAGIYLKSQLDEVKKVITELELLHKGSNGGLNLQQKLAQQETTSYDYSTNAPKGTDGEFDYYKRTSPEPEPDTLDDSHTWSYYEGTTDDDNDGGEEEEEEDPAPEPEPTPGLRPTTRRPIKPTKPTTRGKETETPTTKSRKPKAAVVTSRTTKVPATSSRATRVKTTTSRATTTSPRTTKASKTTSTTTRFPTTTTSRATKAPTTTSRTTKKSKTTSGTTTTSRPTPSLTPRSSSETPTTTFAVPTDINTIAPIVAVTCPDNQFLCKTLTCIDQGKVCDGYFDCKDRSDEETCRFCAPSFRQCANGTCLQNTEICDGDNDCLEGTDEKSCTKLSEDLDSDHISVQAKSGYLMHRRNDQWYLVCYTGNSIDRRSGLNREEKAVTDLCSAFLGYRLPRVTFQRRPITNISGELPQFLLYGGSSVEISSECISGIAVHAQCPDLGCATNESVSVKNDLNVFLKSSQPGEWPWIAFIYVDGVVQCSATIISNRTLITSGSCVLALNSSSMEVKVGSLRLESNSPFEKVYQVSFVILHELYDIALIETLEHISLSHNVHPICLPRDEDHFPEDGDSCRISGMGNADFSSDVVWDTAFTIDANCSSELCGELTDGGCDELKGGAIFCQEEDQEQIFWYFAGLVKSPSTCAGSHGEYLKVSRFESWIKENAN